MNEPGQDDSDAEEDAQHDADGRVFSHARKAAQDRDDTNAQQSRDQCPNEHGGQISLAERQKAEAQSGQRRVGEGIAEQSPAAQHGEAADQPCPGPEQADADAARSACCTSRQPASRSQRFGCGIEHVQSRSVCPSQIVRCQRGVSRAAGDESHVEQDDVIEVLRHGPQIVMDGDDRLALVAQPFEQSEDERFGGGIDAGHRLVHEINVGPLGQGPGEKRSLLLPAGKLPDLTVGEVGHADIVEARPSPIPAPHFPAGETSRAGRRFPSARHRAR